MPADPERIEYLHRFADELSDLALRARQATVAVARMYEARDRAAVFAPGATDVRSGVLHNLGAVIVASLVFAEAAVSLAERGDLPERLGLEVTEDAVGEILDGAVMPTLRWGALYRWWNEYESGLRSVLGTVYGNAPHNAGDFPRLVRSEALVGDLDDWEAHFDLCRTLRNLGHNADRFNPAWDGETRVWRERAVRFEPGRFPADLNDWPAWWHDTLLAAVQFWSQVLLHDKVIAVERISS